MSASEKDKLEKSASNGPQRKLGIIAGGGDLPEKLVKACEKQERPFFIVALKGQTDSALIAGREHIITRLGAGGDILKSLKARDIKDLVMIGSVRRPALAELKPDMRTARFFARAGLRALGDDGLLRALKQELENEGFAIHGIQDFIGDLLARPGPVGQYKPKKADEADIAQGFRTARRLGTLDIGQAVVVQDGIVLGVEGAEGTDSLIGRCGPLQRKGRGAVLVKTCKPQQDRNFDLPTIGPDTVRLCAAQGFRGIVIQAGHSLLPEPEEVAALADHHKIFVTAVNADEYDDES